MLKSPSALYLQAGPSSRQTTSVSIHPSALLTILDHYLRRPKDEERVIGTLLGTRGDNNSVDIKSAFAVPFQESAEQVHVDYEYLRTMFELGQKVNSREIIVGWYSTGSELNSYSALLQNFFSDQTAPFQAVHLLVGTGTQKGDKEGLGVKAFVSSPVGVTLRSENCVFVPIPCELRFHSSERGGLDVLLSSASQPQSQTPVQDGSLDAAERTLQSTIAMIDRVLGYVRQVLSGEIDGNEKVGKALLDALNETIATGGAGGEGAFNEHLQDSLMVSYVASLVRSQVEVSTRLALVT